MMFPLKPPLSWGFPRCLIAEGYLKRETRMHPQICELSVYQMIKFRGPSFFSLHSLSLCVASTLQNNTRGKPWWGINQPQKLWSSRDEITYLGAYNGVVNLGEWDYLGEKWSVVFHVQYIPLWYYMYVYVYTIIISRSSSSSSSIMLIIIVIINYQLQFIIWFSILIVYHLLSSIYFPLYVCIYVYIYIYVYIIIIYIIIYYI